MGRRLKPFSTKGGHMLGLIHTVLESFVVEKLGDVAWQQVIDGANLDNPDAAFTSLGYYPDEDILALIDSAVEVSGIARPDLLVQFGTYLAGALAQRYPDFFSSRKTTKEFLMTVHAHIHVEVKKLHPDVTLPEFSYEDPGPKQLTMIYRSVRKL